jgi:Bacteriophage protein of unknown function (DUF646).
MITVDLKRAKREFFRIRGRFIKLERTVVANALLAASEPIDQAAEAGAPVGITGRLRSRIGPTLIKKGTFARLRVDIGPIRFGKSDKSFPFYGRFQELGWKATGRATRKTAKHPRQISGKHFLRNAGQQNFARAESIFAARIFAGFAEIQSAGEELGLV